MFTAIFMISIPVFERERKSYIFHVTDNKQKFVVQCNLYICKHLSVFLWEFAPSNTKTAKGESVRFQVLTAAGMMFRILNIKGESAITY
jgi:hypothetical protein